MSFSTWPVTLRQNRVDTLPDTPVGRTRLVRALRGDDQHHAERRADLDDELGVRPAACLPCFGWANRFCASSMTQHERAAAAGCACAAICRVTRLSGHSARSSALSRSVRRIDLGAQQLQRLGGVADRLVIDAGHEPVGDPLQRVQVAGALQLVDPHLGQRVQRDAAGQDPHGGCLALPRDRAEQPVARRSAAALTTRPRTSVPNGTGWKTSACPPRSSGHGACLALATS